MGPSGYTESDNHAPTIEPSLQHKKRVDGPPTSLSTEYFSKPSVTPEYTLLGQQDKFAKNVKYQAKQTAPGGMYKNKENIYSEIPPRKQLKMQKRTKPYMKEHHPTASRSFQYMHEAQTPTSPPPAPREQKINIELKKAMKDKDLRDVLGGKASKSKIEEHSTQAALSKQKKDVSKTNVPLQADKRKGFDGPVQASQEVNRSKELRDVHQDAPRTVNKASGQEPQANKTRHRPEEVPSVMNEFVQTNMKKGLAVSGPEAPADYVLKYKARIAPPRQAGKVSEYQKQFQWKEGFKNSPLLNAEEIVFRSQADIGPYKKDHVPKVSEYRHQFNQWKKPEAFSAGLNLNNNNNNSSNYSYLKVARKKKTPAKRSKSAGAAHQYEDSADEEADIKVADSDPGELRAKLKKTHGKIRRVTTEYQANFRSPTSYRYDHGAWKGAVPPQLMPQFSSGEAALNINANSNTNNNNNSDAENPLLSNWFSEVIELRRRAEEYRKRAQGTHFSREHLVQLLAKQNDCWDINSEASSTIKALNLESPAGRVRMSKNVLAMHSVLERNSPEVSDVDDTVQKQEAMRGKETIKKRKEGNNNQGRKSRKIAWLEEHKEKIEQQKRRLEMERARLENESIDDYSDKTNEVKQEGRLPTPVLQQNTSPARRHHLDLTTPSVGGALLTCPPSKDDKMIVTSRTGSSYVTASDDYPLKSLHKTYKIDNLWATMPIYGKPSEDTHYLRNDSADADKPLETEFVASPTIYESDEDKENQDVHIQPRRKSKNKRPGGLTAVPEGYGRTYNLSKPGLNLDNLHEEDDDVMSVSLMSVASSSSLASEVLERTKKRQEFWNKNF